MIKLQKILLNLRNLQCFSFNSIFIFADVDTSFEGDYTCSVQNVYGRDSIVYSVSILQVPDPPLLSVVSTSGTSISLSWTKSTNKLPIVELIVHYRPAVTDARSHTKSVDANEDGTVLEDLQCGTQVISSLISIIPFNK